MDVTVIKLLTFGSLFLAVASLAFSCGIAYARRKWQTLIDCLIDKSNDFYDLASEYGDLRAEYERLNNSYAIAYELLKKNGLIGGDDVDSGEHEESA